ncbi:hypothetical protein CI109_105783 [Kwoniella shandongensis]|uniref:Uncharacterized protein n=1 Tax=Kwoniella shandongensis TaxID=1734106 RepID=A0A5M6C1V3_9TREE|nr:uncharacterized protein CI109_003122 [Kwoniella shandongensis]KAA5528590.1 hypothetical protein CI109_003122 [Kwoniella shandongensis]
MVYIKNWTDFETAATDLYGRSPNKVRYSVKFVAKTGHLVLKLTDDVKCIKYKTFSSIILNRFESLNLRLLTKMSNRTRIAPPPTTTAAQSLAIDTPERGGTPAPEEGAGSGAGAAVTGTGTPAGKTGGGAGGKKKKKGKR